MALMYVIAQLVARLSKFSDFAQMGWLCLYHSIDYSSARMYADCPRHCPTNWNCVRNMYALIILIDQIINLYIWSLLAYLIIGWLVAFRIVNPWQPVVRMISDLLARIHEPLLQPVRRILPDLGAIDISPIVLFLAAQFLRNLLHSFT